MKSMKRRAILVSLLTIIVVAAVIVGYAAPNLAKPNSAEMREFRLSKFTDEGLRELHSKVQAAEDERRAANEKVVSEAEAAVYARIAECSAKIDDPAAYRARHPEGCPRPPSPMRPMRERTTDEAVEQVVMGRCGFVSTVWEARHAGCLP
jgi:hypothetical protein